MGEEAVDRRQAAFGAAACMAGIGGGIARAEDFPTRPLTIMAPTNPGGGWDIFARAIQQAARAEGLSPKPIEVINRGGAGGTIGLAELVSRRRGDPHIVMATGSVMVSSSVAHNSPVRLADAAPLAKIASDYLVVAVPTASPYRTLGELLEAFRSTPGAFAWCGGSAGGIDHMLFGMIAEAVGVSPREIRYVAYAGAGEATAAIVGGQVPAGVTGYSEWSSLRDDGRVRFLAVSSPRRIDADTPTLIESGLALSMENWRGLVLPPGVSAEATRWWTGFVRRLHESPRWREIALRYAWHDTYLEGPELARFIAREEAQAGKVLVRLGISSGGSGYAAVGPWTFPAAIGVAGAAAVAGLALERRSGRAGMLAAAVADEARAVAETADARGGGDEAPPWLRFAAAVALTAAYLVALNFVGFLAATPFLIVAACRLIGSRALVRDLVAALAMTGGAWVLFTRLLHIALP